MCDAEALKKRLIGLESVESAEVFDPDYWDDAPDNWVDFEIPDGVVPPEVSRALADTGATLIDGCITNGYHEFRARVEK